MSVRLIAGRAGSGKTQGCQTQIVRALADSLTQGPRLVMLVPEQAGLQMERGLLAMSPARVLGRCEVLSFRRLAHRILNDASGPMPTALTPLGRQMALRHLVSRHRKSLNELARVADRGGVIAALAGTIVELIQEGISPEQLETGAAAVSETDDPSATRLRDLALLYRAYLDYLGSRRVDPEGVLDLARSRLEAVGWLDGAHVWIDGFAGLTRQQVRMVAAIAQRAAQVDVALLLDPERGRGRDLDAQPDDLSLFARTERTWFALARTIYEAGVPIEPPVLLTCETPPRFASSPILARLERGLFATPPTTQEPDSKKPASSTASSSSSSSSSSPPSSPFSQSLPSSAAPLSRTAALHDEAASPRSRISASQTCDSSPVQGVRLVAAPDRRTEVEAAVQAMVDLVQADGSGLRYRDVSIVVRSLEPYHELVSAALRTRGIPFFIDRRRPTHHHPLVQLVRSVLAMRAGGPFDEAVAMLLKSGLSGLSDEQADALENYVLAHGLVSPESWDEPWRYPPTPDEGEVRRRPRKQPSVENAPVASDPVRAETRATVPPEVQAIDAARRRLRQIIGDWWPVPSQQQGRPSCRAWMQQLYERLTRLNVPEQLGNWCDEAVARGDLDEAAEHEYAWTHLVKLFDETVDALGDERMTGRQLADVIEAGLAEFTLALAPATVDQVLVGSIERSRHPSVRAVFVLGFNDGEFPARPTDQGLLGDEERALLDRCGVELSRTRARQLLDERMLAYIAVTRPSRFLWVSYAETDEAGRALQPSPYLAHLRAAVPEAPVETLTRDAPEAIGTAGQLAAMIARRARAWRQRADDGDPDASAPTGSRDPSRVECVNDTTRGGSSRDPAAAERPRGAARGESASNSAQGGSSRETAGDGNAHETAGPGEAAAGARARDAVWMALYDWARTAGGEPTSATRRALASLAPPRPAVLTATAAAALWPAPYRTSVTRLEAFARCPFQHFAAHGLSLKPRPRHEIDPLSLGRLYHLVLEQFVNELAESGGSLAEMPTDRIAASLDRLCGLLVPQYAEAFRLEPPKQRALIRRGGRELRRAAAGEQTGLGKTPLWPAAAELQFGDAADADLPALRLRLSDGRQVLVRGSIDRIDLLQAGEDVLAVVFDYKRSIGRRLKLEEVYHGLALQLLAYLLVIRDYGTEFARRIASVSSSSRRRAVPTALIPGGAFYLPLLTTFEKLAHPADAEHQAAARKGFQPRGVVDFDWMDWLEPTLESGRSEVFAVRRKKDGSPGDIDRTDAVGGETMPALLDHVRRKMTELSEAWLSGDIAARPSRLGTDTPCGTCLYRSVCRMEYVTREARTLQSMKRSDVFAALSGAREDDLTRSSDPGK